MDDSMRRSFLGRISPHKRDWFFKKRKHMQKLKALAASGHRLRCSYCGTGLTTDEVSLDHVLPVAHGGTNKANNIVPACLSCNQTKGCDRDWEVLVITPGFWKWEKESA